MNQDEQNRLLLSTLEFRIRSSKTLGEYNYLKLTNSCAHQQVKLITNRVGRQCGYIAWANISNETLRQILQFGAMPFYLHEWNEGRIPLITDVCTTLAQRRIKKRDFLDLFDNKKLIVTARENRINVYRRLRGKFRLAYRRVLTPDGNPKISS